MERTLSILSFVVLVGVTSISAQAACGGGGYKPAAVAARSTESKNDYKPAPVATRSTEVQYVSRASELSSPKLRELQREIDKAQAKYDNCTGDCDKERRKLDEAKAKYARVAGPSVSSR